MSGLLLWIAVGALAPLIRPATAVTGWLGLGVKTLVCAWIALLIVYSIQEETWRHPAISFNVYLNSDDTKEVVNEMLSVWIVYDTLVASFRAIYFSLLRRVDRDQRVFANSRQWALGFLPLLFVLLTFPFAWQFFAQNSLGR